MAEKQAMLQYLAALEQNNERPWYHAHKAEKKVADHLFENLVQALLFSVGQNDGSILHLLPGEITYRLPRDSRFSKDKSPYNPSYRAHLAPGGKQPIPVGYYLMVKPGDRSFLAGGLFTDYFKEATALVRDAIAEDDGAFAGILQAPSFGRYFAGIKGKALKNTPRGYDPLHPLAPYIKHKSWFVQYPVTDAMLMADGFVEQATEIYAAMQPLVAFLNTALADFRYPERW